MKPTVLTGVLKPLVINLDSLPVELSVSFQKEVDNFWNEINETKRFTRGEVYHVDAIEEKEDIMNVNLRISDYAHYLYSVRNQHVWDEVCKVIYGAGLVETSDSYFIFGEMGTKTAYPGRLQCVGGGLSRQDLHGHNFDLEKSVLRELSEELGINKKDDIKDCCVKFIKTGGNYDFIAVLFHINLDMTLHQFQSRYEEYCYALKLIDENPEFQSIVVLENNPESIEVFIRNEKRDSVDYLYPFLQEMSRSNNGASLK